MGVAVEKYKPRSLGSVAALTRSGRKLHQAVGKKEGQALALAIGCGYHLFALKVETAQNGDWGRVCEQVAGSPRTARTYMQIALGFRQSPAEIEAAGTIENALGVCRDLDLPKVTLEVARTFLDTFELPENIAPQPEDDVDWSDEERGLRAELEQECTVVINLGTHTHLMEWAERRGLLVRIDRTTVWGNPFRLDDDGDRETVIANYRLHYLPHKPSLHARLTELEGKALGCWCAPEACHGDVLADIVGDGE
jgi:hypothetical protein